MQIEWVWLHMAIHLSYNANRVVWLHMAINLSYNANRVVLVTHWQ